MKVAIIFDQLITRNYSIDVLEAVLGLFNEDEVHLYTLAHHPGKILGISEQHKVYSSFLSKFITNIEDFNKANFKKIIGARSLKVNDQYDLSVTLTSGFSQLVKLPNVKKKILLELDQSSSKLVKFFTKKDNNKFDLTLNLFSGEDFDKISPFHKVDKVELANAELEFVTVFANNTSDVLTLRKTLLSQNLKINWIGIDGESSAKEKFLADICIKDLSKILNHSLFCIDNGNPLEPNYLLALMAGRPAIVLNKNAKQIPFQDQSLYFATPKVLDPTIDQVLSELKFHDASAMRRKAGVYNSRRFKKELFDKIRDLGE